MVKMTYKGIITALVTPTDSNDNLDEKRLKHLIDFQLRNKVNGVVLLGGTGEYNAISLKDKKRAIKITVDTIAKKIPVIVGIVEPGLPNAIEIGRYSRDVGADAVMVITPYYVHPTQVGIIDYYQKFDAAVDLPIVLYNIPHRTGVNI